MNDNEKTSKKLVSVRIDASIYEALKTVSEWEHRSIGAQAGYMIVMQLAEYGIIDLPEELIAISKSERKDA